MEALELILSLKELPDAEPLRTLYRLARIPYQDHEMNLDNNPHSLGELVGWISENTPEAFSLAVKTISLALYVSNPYKKWIARIMNQYAHMAVRIVKEMASNNQYGSTIYIMASLPEARDNWLTPMAAYCHPGLLIIPVRSTNCRTLTPQQIPITAGMILAVANNRPQDLAVYLDLAPREILEDPSLLGRLTKLALEHPDVSLLKTLADKVELENVWNLAAATPKLKVSHIEFIMFEAKHIIVPEEAIRLAESLGNQPFIDAIQLYQKPAKPLRYSYF